MNPLTFSITLALSATPAEVAQAHDAIDRFFGVTAAPGVDPADLLPAANGNNGDEQPNANAPAVDSAGMPWDARIHSSSKALNANNTWRYRKNLSPTEKTKVEAEIRATLLTAAAAAIPAATATNAVPTMPPPPQTAALPSMPPLPGANVETPFTRFVKFLAENTQSPENPQGRLTVEWVKAALTNYGVANGDMQNLAHAAAELVNNIENGIRTALGLPTI